MSTSSAGNSPMGFSLKIGSRKIDHTYPLHSINIEKKINKIPHVKIILYDGDVAQQKFILSNSNDFAIGVKVTIEAGYDSSLKPIFEGILTTIGIRSREDGTSMLIISCKDEAYKTTLTPKTKVFVKSKDSDAMKKALGESVGLKVDVEGTTIQHESLFQHEITDWDFVNMRAEANGQVVVVNDGKVSVKKPGVKGSSVLTVTYGEDMYAFEAEIDVRNQWKGAVGVTWDPKGQKEETVKASEPGEYSFGNIGYSKLLSINKQDPVTLYHGGELGKKEMQTLVTSLLERSRIAKVQGKVTIQGDNTIHPDQLIDIKKGAAHFEGKAYVSGVQHVITKGNWRTILTLGLSAERYVRQYRDVTSLPAAGMLPPVHGLQIGTVKQLDKDPKSESRILVILPMTHEKKEGVWCRVASLYASNKVGAFFMPEIGDEVVVGFVNDDLRSPIIVGSLYSSKQATPTPIEQNNTIKTITSREKIEINFYDEKGKPELELKTPQGRIIRISDKKKSIEILDGSVNKIILSESGINFNSNKDITIDGKSVTIKSKSDLVLQGVKNVNIKGLNVTAKASMKAALLGSVCTEVKSSAIAILKGATVMIN